MLWSDMQRSFLAQFGEYLLEKRNFIKVGTIGFGVPFTAFIIWLAGGYGGAGWWLFLALLAMMGGWVWAILMWAVLQGNIRQISSELRSKREDEGTRP